jgi:hypothetical protein
MLTLPAYTRRPPFLLMRPEPRQKCNREHPCGTCVRRGQPLACTYPTNATHQPRGRQDQAPDRPSASVQDRIRHLEDLVVNLMKKTAPGSPVQEPQITTSGAPNPMPILGGLGRSSPLPDETTDDAASQSDYGSMTLSSSGVSYVSSAHWAAILDGIADLKNHFEKDEDSQDSRPTSGPSFHVPTGPQLLYGCPQYTTREDILASVPERRVVDRLVSRYYNSFEMSPGQYYSLE